jgi:hypothetical protein
VLARIARLLEFVLVPGHQERLFWVRRNDFPASGWSLGGQGFLALLEVGRLQELDQLVVPDDEQKLKKRHGHLNV